MLFWSLKLRMNMMRQVSSHGGHRWREILKDLETWTQQSSRKSLCWEDVLRRQRIESITTACWSNARCLTIYTEIENDEVTEKYAAWDLVGNEKLVSLYVHHVLTQFCFCLVFRASTRRFVLVLVHDPFVLWTDSQPYTFAAPSECHPLWQNSRLDLSSTFQAVEFLMLSPCNTGDFENFHSTIKI